MNSLTIIGNLCADPQLRSAQTENGPVDVCTVRVAVNGMKDRTDYFNVSCWRGLAQSVHRYTRKGTKIAARGPVSCRVYTTSAGETRAVMEVEAETVEFLTRSQAGAENVQAQAPEQPTESFTNVEDDDLPF